MMYSMVGLSLGATLLESWEIGESIKRKIHLRSDEKVLIMSDDIFRPNTVLHMEVLDYVIKTVGRDNVIIVVASGMHRASTLQEIESKFSAKLDGIRLYRNSPLVSFPFADFSEYTRISIGTIMPHIFVKRSGGGKVVVPGLTSVAGAINFHKLTRSEAVRYIRRIERGIDYVVSGVINRLGEVVNIVINDIPVRLSEERMSKYNFGVILDEPADVVVLEPLFKNGDFMQAMNVLRLCKYNIVNDGGTICIKCSPKDGIGVHYIFQQVNGIKPAKFDVAFSELIGDRKLAVICPTISRLQIDECFEKPITHYKTPFDLYDNCTNLKVSHYLGADVMLPQGE